MLSVVRQRSLRRVGHSSRGLLPTVLLVVLSRNLVNEEALAQRGAVSPKRRIMEKVFEANVNITEYSSHDVQLFSYIFF